MSWLKIVTTGLQLLLVLVTLLRNRQQLAAGEAEAIADYLRRANDAVQKARAARARAGADKLPDDDPYLRD